jgi:hypothetical protein
MVCKIKRNTNAKSKFISKPEALEDCHYRRVVYLNNNENSELFTGKSLRLGSSQIHEQQLFFCALSAILIENMPIGLNLATPSNRISLMSDWETKIAYY